MSKLTFSVVIPCLIIGSVNAYNLWTEHWEHWAHMPPLEERTEYPYQNLRTKNYFWGDGDKVSAHTWQRDQADDARLADPLVSGIWQSCAMLNTDREQLE